MALNSRNLDNKMLKHLGLKMTQNDYYSCQQIGTGERWFERYIPHCCIENHCCETIIMELQRKKKANLTSSFSTEIMVVKIFGLYNNFAQIIFFLIYKLATRIGRRVGSKQ